MWNGYTDFACLTVPKSSHRVMVGYIETKALMNFCIYIVVCPHIALIVLRTIIPPNAHTASAFRLSVIKLAQIIATVC